MPFRVETAIEGHGGAKRDLLTGPAADSPTMDSSVRGVCELGGACPTRAKREDVLTGGREPRALAIRHDGGTQLGHPFSGAKLLVADGVTGCVPGCGRRPPGHGRDELGLGAFAGSRDLEDAGVLAVADEGDAGAVG